MRAIVAPHSASYRRLQGTGLSMRFEVVEEAEAWIVRSEGGELARYRDQETALHDVADRLRDVGSDEPASLSVRYRSKAS